MNYFKIYEHCAKTRRNRIISLSVQGNLVASGSWDKTVQVWNMETNENLWDFGYEFRVTCVKLQDNWLVSSATTQTGSKHEIRVCNVETGEELHRISEVSWCSNFDINPSMTVLAVACEKVILWDLKTATKIKEFNLLGDIFDLKFNPAGDKLIVGSRGGEVSIIELKFDFSNEDEES